MLRRLEWKFLNSWVQLNGALVHPMRVTLPGKMGSVQEFVEGKYHFFVLRSSWAMSLMSIGFHTKEELMEIVSVGLIKLRSYSDRSAKPSHKHLFHTK
jgi:hypothetical protein